MIPYTCLFQLLDGQGGASDASSDISSTADLLGEGEFEELSKQIERERSVLVDDCLVD